MPQWAVGSGPGERNNASEMDCLPSPWFSLERERESGPPPAACLLDWIHIHSVTVWSLLLHPAPSRSGRSCLPSCSRQQQHVASRWRCAGASQGLLPDLGKWTTLLALCCVAPKWPGKPHLISRRSPFWCSEICCAGFYFFYL